MRTLLVDTIQGKKEETVYNISDFPFLCLDNYDLCKKGSHRKYYNVPSAFDIETTNVDGVKMQRESILSLLLRSCIIGSFVLINM